MNRISRTELRSLASLALAPSLSVYLPLERNFPDARQNGIRFRNLVDQALEQFNGDHRSAEVKDLLKPVRELEADSVFWRPGSADGLCVLSAPGFFRTIPLPYRCQELVETGRRFHLSPLTHAMSRDDRYYLLAISQKSVRLYRGRGQDFEAVTLPANVPTSMAQAIPGLEIDHSQQHHVTSSRTVSGSPAAVKHGTVNPKDDVKPQVREYCHIIARHIDSVLGGDNAPLVIAAVSSSQALFRECSKYPHITETGVIGSPDDLSETELHKRALPIVEPLFRRDFQRAAERYRELIASARAGHQLHTIVPAAVQGRCEVVFSSLGEHRYGTCDPDGSHVSVHPRREPGDVDLLDLAVSHTLLHGGDAFVVPKEQVPTDGPVAALFRW